MSFPECPGVEKVGRRLGCRGGKRREKNENDGSGRKVSGLDHGERLCLDSGSLGLDLEQ